MYPGVVFDLGEHSLSPEFCLSLAKKLKSSTNGNSTVSIGSLAKIVKKVVSAEPRGGQWAWTEREALESSARLLDGGTGRVPWQKYIHFLLSHYLPSVCPLSSLSELGRRLREEGAPVPKKQGFLSLPLATFLSTELWFEADGAMSSAAAALIKQAYAAAFEGSNGLVDMTSFLLCVACSPESPIPGLSSSESGTGLYRAMVALSGGHTTPSVEKRGLETLLEADYTSPSLGFANEVFEGKGEGETMFFSAVKEKSKGWKAFAAVKVVSGL